MPLKEEIKIETKISSSKCMYENKNLLYQLASDWNRPAKRRQEKKAEKEKKFLVCQGLEVGAKGARERERERER